MLTWFVASPAARAQDGSATQPARAVRSVVVQFDDGTEQRLAQAAPAPSPAPSEPAPPARTDRSLLGVNVGNLSDHSRNRMFIDAMKTSRRFGRPDKPWVQDVVLDPRSGYPGEDAGVVVFTEQVDVNGTYKFSCTGRVDLRAIDSPAAVENLAYDTAADRTTADVVFRADDGKPASLFLSFRNTAGGIRDVKLIRPGYDDDSAVFTREFLAALAPFGVLRFMDYSATNDSPLVEWNDRNTPDAAQYTDDRGGPWEYAVDVGNLTGKDIWLCVPHQASDAFVTELARMVERRLKPGLNVYVEYSNEVWNGDFKQHRWNTNAAKAEVAAGDTTLSDGGEIDNIYYWAWRRVGKRTAEIARIFRAEFGEDGADRVRPVLAGQVARIDVVTKGLEYIDKHVAPPRDVLYGIAGAPYMGHDKQLFEAEGATVDQICEMMLRRSAAGSNKRVLAQHELAKKYGVRSIAYEGGVSLGQEKTALDAKIRAQYDERAGQAVEQYLRNWFTSGGGEFVYYNHVSRYSRHGFWGLTEDLGNPDTPKMRAAVRVAEEFRSTNEGQD